MVMRPRPGLQTLATLAFLTPSRKKRLTYVFDSQCDSCCIRAAMADSRNPVRRNFGLCMYLELIIICRTVWSIVANDVYVNSFLPFDNPRPSLYPY